MHSFLRLLMGFVLLSCSLVACGGGTTHCTTGMTVACACLGGTMAVQTCGTDGTYGACTGCPSSTDAGPLGNDAATDTAVTDGLANDTGVPIDVPVGACPPPFTVCNGTCTDTQADAANCGACGNACAEGVLCYAGTCTGSRLFGHYVPSTVATSTFLDACALPLHDQYLMNLPALNDRYVVASVPFPFTFYDRHPTTVQIAQNGTFAFDPGVGSLNDSYGTCSSTSAIIGSYAVAAYVSRASLQTRAMGVCSGVSGTAPTRAFVITWEDVAYEGGATNHATFSAVLYEATDGVDLQYETVSGIDSDGGQQVVGVVGSDPTMPSLFECGMAGSLTAGMTVRFSPGP